MKRLGDLCILLRRGVRRRVLSSRFPRRATRREKSIVAAAPRTMTRKKAARPSRRFAFAVGAKPNTRRPMLVTVFEVSSLVAEHR
ncbi:hypothetical protein AKJ09_08011 [Labilithrix luteola]|uniref:Uncharacterized protein n=1 Tax=Labilithrix luteola TaxID=1391654 RepID=A0A0K1Q6I7_9BACT|nr:hypothetical protein AKJ09_08011 [Labilithrix luteola]